MKSPDVDVNVALNRLRRASYATRKLLFGNLVGTPAVVVVQPDLTALRPKLDRLSGALSFNCLELAKILACQPKLMAAQSPVELAARSILRSSRALKLLTIFDSTGLSVIRAAADAGDVEFFIRLGARLRHLSGPKAAKSLAGNLSQLPFILVSSWQPLGSWPGLAYCKTSAIMDALAMFAGVGKTDDDAFERFWGCGPKAMAKNLDRTLQNLGLVRSAHPIVSHLEFNGHQAPRSLVFS